MFFLARSSWSRFSRFSRLLNSRERRNSKSALKNRRSSQKYYRFQLLHLTGVKKGPYNLSLNSINLADCTVIIIICFFLFCFLRMHKYHNRFTFHARLRMCHVYACVLHFFFNSSFFFFCPRLFRNGNRQKILARFTSENVVLKTRL